MYNHSELIHASDIHFITRNKWMPFFQLHMFSETNTVVEEESRNDELCLLFAQAFSTMQHLWVTTFSTTHDTC